MNEPVWYRHERDRGERFSRALEHGISHRDDEEFREELAVVSALRELGTDEVLDAPAKDRMLARIQAMAAEEASSSVASERSTRPVPIRRAPVPSERRRHTASLAAAAVAATVIAFGALGVELAKDALPGDLLYDVKRTTEAVSLDLTFSSTSKAHKHLQLASQRVAELEGLVDRDNPRGRGAAGDAETYNAVLADLAKNAEAGTAGITTYATQYDGNALIALHDWATQHAARLDAVKQQVPAGAQQEFVSSAELLNRIEQRARELAERMHCYRITSSETDELGAIPAGGVCDPVPNAEQQIPITTRAGSAPTTGAHAEGTASGRTPATDGSEPAVQEPQDPVTAAQDPADTGDDVSVPDLDDAEVPSLQDTLGNQRHRTAAPDPTGIVPLP